MIGNKPLMNYEIDGIEGKKHCKSHHSDEYYIVWSMDIYKEERRSQLIELLQSKILCMGTAK